MPQNSDGFYQESDHGLTVTARALPGGDRRTYLCLAGEIDMASSAVLAKAVDWLTALSPVSVLVDLAELTFACSTLPNFVVRVRRAVSDDAELTLWRPRPAIDRVLRVTDMATIATIRDESTDAPTGLV
ncbi:STAS domain-containing protein [Plantactinospora veratri]